MGRFCLTPVLYVLFATFLAPVQGGDAGRVFFQRLAAPALDRWTNAPSPAEQQWFQNHFERMAVFSPYFDRRTSWYRNGLVYVNLYGIPTASSVLREHPEWILHDSRGQRLYIPWKCAEGVCPQYAGNIADPAFRSWWIGQTRSAISRGTYRGLWIDDVNLEFRVSDGSGRQVPPVDSSTGGPMTWDLWRNHIAEFLSRSDERSRIQKLCTTRSGSRVRILSAIGMTQFGVRSGQRTTLILSAVSPATRG